MKGVASVQGDYVEFGSAQQKYGECAPDKRDLAETLNNQANKRDGFDVPTLYVACTAE